jgi:hypothetical protein
MGYDILSNTTQKSWSCHHDWGCFLDLAEAFGWVPEHKGIHYYIGNNYQKVSDEDAFAMATALNMAIAYLKDAPVNMTANGTILRTFDATDITHLRALASLGGAGGFTIA